MPGRSSRSGVRSDGLEGYARTFLAAAFRVAGADGADPHGWLPRYAEGLAAGTENPDRDDEESWPQIRDHDVFGQPMVEAASVALGLRLTRPWLWDSLTSAQQDRAEAWLRGALVSVPASNNWYLFPYAVAGFLESVGRGDELTARTRRRGLDLLDSWYAGQGWYADGEGGGFDYYNGWALHLYPVLDELMVAREARAAGSPALAGLAGSVWSRRLAEHLESFRHFFAADGAPVHFGRSMTYRFAAGAAIGLGAAVGATPLSPGASRRIISGTMRHFFEHGCLNEYGLLSLGWYRAHEPTCQSYSGPASPYWASKAFVALLAPADHPLWASAEEPAPVEETDRVVAVEPAGLLLQTTSADGLVRLHNHGSDHFRAETGDVGAGRDPLYNRCAYSSATGPTDTHNVEDNEFTVIWRGRRGQRRRAHTLGAGAGEGWGWIASWHRPVFTDGAPVVPGLQVRSVTVVRGAYELRIHAVTGAPDRAWAETTGWAVPDPRLGTAAAVRAGLHGLSSWESQDSSAAPAGTAFTPAARVERLRGPLEPGESQIFVAVAALQGGGESAEPIVGPELGDVLQNLQIGDGELSFRWAGDSETTRVALDPVSVTRA